MLADIKCRSCIHGEWRAPVLSNQLLTTTSMSNRRAKYFCLKKNHEVFSGDECPFWIDKEGSIIKSKDW